MPPRAQIESAQRSSRADSVVNASSRAARASVLPVA